MCKHFTWSRHLYVFSSGSSIYLINVFLIFTHLIYFCEIFATFLVWSKHETLALAPGDTFTDGGQLIPPSYAAYLKKERVSVTLSWVSVSSLQQCSKSCGSGHRRRTLHCVDYNQQEVHEMYCMNQIRPPDMESCNTHACELIWITGEWTEVSKQAAPIPRCWQVEYCYFMNEKWKSSLHQCSVSCGQGYRQRLISCSEVHVENDNYEYGHQSLSNCPGTPPESYMPCNLGQCPPPQEWRAGIWGRVCLWILPSNLSAVDSLLCKNNSNRPNWKKLCSVLVQK